MTRKKGLKVCLAASAGGHATQLLRVASAWEGCEVHSIVTTDVVRGQFARFGRVDVVGECNREHPLRVLGVLRRCWKVLRRERPEVVISSGAAVGCLACYLGRLLGARVVWIDSITNVERPSLSGRMVRFIADVFLVQWPELARKYRRAEYRGALV